LQGSFIDTHAAQLAATTVYITWFLVPVTTAFGVLLFRPRDYWRFIAFLLLVYYAVMPFFALYPLEAPWAHDPGIRRYVAEMFPEAAAADPNPYAAMPSLHVGLTAAAAFWYGLRTWPGRIVLGYSALIGLVVVYGGDHYLADVLGGYAIAGVSYFVARRLRLPVFARANTSAPVPIVREVQRAA
jgi:membrane-associated phospholipid phosphatase